jgi:hypothetical protein
VAQIELVGSEYDPAAESEQKDAATKAKPKGVGGRLRAAAERLRGRKSEAAEGEAGEEGAPKARPARAPRDKSAKPGRTDTRGKAKGSTTPRKAGGS